MYFLKLRKKKITRTEGTRKGMVKKLVRSNVTPILLQRRKGSRPQLDRMLEIGNVILIN